MGTSELIFSSNAATKCSYSMYGIVVTTLRYVSAWQCHLQEYIWSLKPCINVFKLVLMYSLKKKKNFKLVAIVLRQTWYSSNALPGRDLFGSHTSRETFVCMLQKKYSINSRELVLEVAHNRIALVSQHGEFILVTFLYSRILIFWFFDNDSEGHQYLDWRV